MQESSASSIGHCFAPIGFFAHGHRLTLRASSRRENSLGICRSAKPVIVPDSKPSCKRSRKKSRKVRDLRNLDEVLQLPAFRTSPFAPFARRVRDLRSRILRDKQACKRISVIPRTEISAKLFSAVGVIVSFALLKFAHSFSFSFLPLSPYFSSILLFKKDIKISDRKISVFVFTEGKKISAGFISWKNLIRAGNIHILGYTLNMRSLIVMRNYYN